MEIKRIPAKQSNKKLKVAAYCRVSTDKSDQEDSLETQKEVYASVISLRSDWEFSGIYSDSFSGLTAKKRKGFMNMITDAMDGKIDRILCKSVSRFSRNVAECKYYADLLMSKNIAVEFEKEHLATDDPTASFIFSLMSAIAENESRSISENVKWGYAERFKRGEYNLGNNRILGYDTVNGKLVPNGDAWAVKMIFELFANGVSLRKIGKALAEKGILTKKGTQIGVGHLQYILRNEAYRGDKILWKSPPRDFITKKPLKERENEPILLQNDHEAIVDEGLWKEVEERINNYKN